MPKPRHPNETPCLAHLHRNSGPANHGGAGTGKGGGILMSFDHLFDIEGKSKVEFEKIDFGVQEVRLDGEVVWWRRYGAREEFTI